MGQAKGSIRTSFAIQAKDPDGRERDVFLAIFGIEVNGSRFERRELGVECRRVVKGGRRQAAARSPVVHADTRAVTLRLSRKGCNRKHWRMPAGQRGIGETWDSGCDTLRTE